MTFESEIMSNPSQSTLHNPTAIHSAQPPIGIDIGGTKINAAIIQPNLKQQEEHISGFQTAPTPATGQEFLDTLVRMINTLKQEYAASSVGIATAGVVDSDHGKILGSTGNLPALRDLPNLKERLEDQVQLPIHMENDANAAAYGEFRAGAAHGAQNAFAITLGTGVGMGIIFDGKLYRGSHFFAAEGGHIVISTHKERMCTCGRWDCWEAFTSGRGLETTADLALKAASDAERSAFVSKFEIDGKVTTYSVMEAVRNQNDLGKAILETWHDHIAVGLGSLINVMDPDLVVVGGGLGQFVDFNRLNQLTQVRSMGKDFKVVPAELGNLAGIVGAAYLALEAHAAQ